MNCCLCGSPANVENAHPDPKGMGGRGKKAPTLAFLTKPLCAGNGSGNLDVTSCHGAHHAAYLVLDMGTGDVLRYCSTAALQEHTPSARKARLALTARGLRLDGMWHGQQYRDDFDPDTVDAPGGDTW